MGKAKTSTNLVVRILLRGVIIGELLIERLHPGLVLFFLLILQLILLPLTALSARFSRRDSDFCWETSQFFKMP